MIIFVFSGFAGLIYQSIWSHYLGLFLGHAAYAQALVLAIFMGGMALGSALVVRAGERWKYLIRIYALIELIIGICALFFHEIFIWVLDVSYKDVIPSLGDMSLVYAYKWGLAALLILPQSVLLGMTFPLMSSGIIRRESNKNGRILGGLYFTNSLGAAIGVLCCAFLIMPAVGLHGALLVAGIMNLCVAFAAFVVGGEATGVVTENKNDANLSGVVSEKRRLLVLMLGGTFLSGAASFVYEVVWIRMLSLAVGSTLHAFELMLATFIAGIAFGGLWIRRKADASLSPMKLLGWMQIIMGLLVALSLMVYASSFEWSSFLINLLAKTDAGYAAYNLGTALLAITIMFPAAFFAGTTLPLFTVVLLRSGVGESAIGRVYAWNTLGAILGVFVAIHVLIPFTGLKLTALIAALVDVLIGMILIRMSVNDDREFARYGLMGFVILSIFAVVSLKAPFNPEVLSSGVYRHGIVHHANGRQMLFYQDGKTASVSVFKGSDSVAIATNGKPDASIAIAHKAPTEDEYTMTLAGALPFAYVDQPKRVGVIGFGSGMTTHVVLSSEHVERVDTVEIEKVMVKGARFFESVVRRAYRDPRSNIVVDDAKSYFSGQQKYNVVISEPSNPWISGIGNLFSTEFYNLVPTYLTDDGVFIQWLQLYEIDNQLVATVLKALTANFADYHAYISNNFDLIIVASPTRQLNNINLERLLEGATGDDLARLGIKTAEQLRLFRVADADILRAYANLYDVKPNSDYFPVLSMKAPAARFKGSQADLLTGLGSSNFPLLEFMNVWSPPAEGGASGEIVRKSNQLRRIDQAHTIRSIFINHTDIESGKNEQEIELAMQLRGVLTDCTDQKFSLYQEKVWVNNLTLLANLTIPYLHPSQQKGMLIDAPWVGCESLPDNAKKLSHLIEAITSRNFVLVEELAKEWLGSVNELPTFYMEANNLALVYLQLAYVAQGEYEKARDVDTEFGTKIMNSDGNDRIRAFILSWLDVKINGYKQ